MMRHRFLTIALIGIAGCGGDDQSNIELGSSDGGGTGQVASGAPPAAPELPNVGPSMPAGSGAIQPGQGSSPTDPSTASGAGTTPNPTPPAGQGGTNPVTSPPQPGAQAVDILNRAEQAYAQVNSMEADFVQQVYVPLLQETVHGHGKIYHRSPDRFLMRFVEPAGDVIVADGQYAYMYYPSTDARSYVRAQLAEGGQQVDFQKEFLSDASQKFDATLTGSETIGGRTTHALTLVPRGSSPYRRIRIWVDASDFLVRRFEITERNESVRTLDISNLKPNVAIADAMFRFTPPAGAQMYEP